MNHETILIPDTSVNTEPPDAADPFYYGTRYVMSYDADNKAIYTRVPLTRNDFLDPQEGDQFVQGAYLYTDVAKLFSIFDRRYGDDPTVGVYSDLKMVWGIPNLEEPCPDVAVVYGLRRLHEDRRSFDVQV